MKPPKDHLHFDPPRASASLPPQVTCSCGGIPGPSKHLSDQQCSPVDNMARLGLLGRKMIAVHMTCLTDEEIKKVAETGESQAV